MIFLFILCTILSFLIGMHVGICLAEEYLGDYDEL